MNSIQLGLELLGYAELLISKKPNRKQKTQVFLFFPEFVSKHMARYHQIPILTKKIQFTFQLRQQIC